MLAVNIVIHFSFENINNKSQGLNNHCGLTLRGLNLMWQKVDLTKIIHLTSDRTEHQKIHEIPVFQVFRVFDVQSDLAYNYVLHIAWPQIRKILGKKWLIRHLYGPPTKLQQHMKLESLSQRFRIRTLLLWTEHKSNPRRYKSCGEIIRHVTSHHSISQIRCFFKSLLLICTAYRVHHFLLSSLQQNFVNHYLYRESFFYFFRGTRKFLPKKSNVF